MDYDRMASYKNVNVIEIKTFIYVLAGRTMADIEILILSDDLFGNQATIRKSQKNISTAKTYDSLEMALEAIIKKVELEIESDEWVKNNQSIDD